MRRKKIYSQKNYQGSLSILLLISFILLTLIGTLVITISSRFHGVKNIFINDNLTKSSKLYNSITVVTNYINVVGDDKTRKIFYTKCQGANDNKIRPHLLLLHGEKYYSNSWAASGSLQTLCGNGFNTFATDLPHYGSSNTASIPKTSEEKGKFIFDLAQALGLDKFILVAPSISGKYAIPALIKPPEKAKESLMVGFVTISPADTNKYKKSDYAKVKIPVMLVIGEGDRTNTAKTSKYWLRNCNNYTLVVIDSAGHDANMEQIKKWNEELLRFLGNFVYEKNDKPSEQTLSKEPQQNGPKSDSGQKKIGSMESGKTSNKKKVGETNSKKETGGWKNWFFSTFKKTDKHHEKIIQDKANDNDDGDDDSDDDDDDDAQNKADQRLEVGSEDYRGE